MNPFLLHKSIYIVIQEKIEFGSKASGLYYTRIMVSKGMVSKSKYSISEKNKGMPVSICPYF